MSGGAAGELHVLCAGAVKGLIGALGDGFEASSGLRLHATFGAVGAMRDALRAGAPCDVFIATAALVDALASTAALRAGTARAIGRVPTAVAVRAGAPLPALDDVEALKLALLGASAIYFPDATLSTAGAHVARVLEQLAIGDAVATRLRMFANGAAAMRALAAEGDARALGCTQATEIRYTPGLALVAPLPAPFALATVYTAAVAASARDVEAAAAFVALLTGQASAALRRAGGFDDPAAPASAA
jgi:molybdate transport system substrate-binding protein